MTMPTTLNGFGPVVPYWFLALLAATFGYIPWLRCWSWQFSLRTLLILITVVAMLLGLGVYFVRH